MKIPSAFLVFRLLLVADLVLTTLPAGAVDRGEGADEEEPSAQEQLGIQDARIGLGTVDSNGWVAAQSPLAGLNASMPCQYSEMTLNPTSAFLNFDSKVMLSCTESSGVGFTIQRTRMAKQPMAAKTIFGYQRDAARAQSQGKEVTARFSALTIQGREAFDVATSGEGFCALSRTVLDGTDMVEMRVLSDAETCKQIATLGPYFVNSLQLPPAPAAAQPAAPAAAE